MIMQTSSKWSNTRVLRDQLERLKQLVNTPAAKSIGINSVADALKSAINMMCEKIENVRGKDLPFLGDPIPE